MSHSAILILFTLAIMALIDYVPRFILVTKKKILTKTGYDRIPRYLIMPTVYGDISYLKNLHFLQKYADKVVVCTSIYETPEFYRELRLACRKYELRYICVDLPKVKGKPVKNAYTIYKGVFNDIYRLGARKNTPCILIDADTYATDNVNNLVRTFLQQDLDIASLRCEVSKPKKVIEKLQDYEYTLAMDNRRMDPWLTSGACNMGRAAVFRHVFSRHSDFFAGGDIEIGKLAQVMGYKVSHIYFMFFTEVPDNFKDWYRQRVIWFAGGTRHHVANMGSFGWYHFFIFFYNSLLVYLLLPLRWIEISNFPLTMLALIVLSWIYTFILMVGKGWRKEYLLLPFYAFFQSMIILPIALGRYCKYAWRQRSLGLLRYDLSRFNRLTRTLFVILNVTTAVLVIYTAGLFTETRINYWYEHGKIMKTLVSLAK